MIRLVRLNEVQYVETDVASKRLQAEGFLIAPIPESEEVLEEEEEKKSRGRTRRKAVSDDEEDAN